MTFTGYDGDRSVQDGAGMIRAMDEHTLTAGNGRVLHRLPAQHALRFGGYAAFPHARLVQ